MSYYRTNVTLMYRVGGDFEQHFTLSEIEDMTPFERSVYLILMENKVKQHEINKQNKKNQG